VTRPVVLVVDDHPMNVKLVTFVLEKRGLEVVSAGSAEQTWAVLEKRTPSVILMDVQLPGTDGLTLTRQLRKDPRFERTPIIAVTAYAMASDVLAARDAGCTEFVAKPIDTQRLGAMVAELAGERAPA
jgi:two-component system cell cycle response regulator/two-component system cell cycle response regulator DivK